MCIVAGGGVWCGTFVIDKSAFECIVIADDDIFLSQHARDVLYVLPVLGTLNFLLASVTGFAAHRALMI